jgi:hypothetical protein
VPKRALEDVPKSDAALKVHAAATLAQAIEIALARAPGTD